MKRDARQILTELHVLRAQGGDERAFRALHALWHADVGRMAHVAVGNHDGAREVAQDAWIAAAKGLGRLQDPACFPRWLFQIVKRRGTDWVRRRQRQRRAHEALTQQAQANAACPGIPPNPARTSLAEAIARLGPAERELLILYYEAGRSIPEIAEILAVPAGTIKSRLHTLRERLRNLIEEETQ